MSLFKELEGDVAIISSGGVYKQVPIYTRRGYLFAKTAGGFVRLMSDGSTSKTNLRLDELHIEGQFFQDQLGRLVTDEFLDGPRKDLDAKKIGRLMPYSAPAITQQKQ